MLLPLLESYSQVYFSLQQLVTPGEQGKGERERGRECVSVCVCVCVCMSGHQGISPIASTVYTIISRV